MSKGQPATVSCTHGRQAQRKRACASDKDRLCFESQSGRPRQTRQSLNHRHNDETIYDSFKLPDSRSYGVLGDSCLGK